MCSSMGSGRMSQGFWDVRYICGLVMRVRGGRGTMGADPHACRLVCVTEGTCTCGRRVGRGVYVPFAPTQADLVLTSVAQG